jgi:deoxyribodipyrimidine photo-lyase
MTHVPEIRIHSANARPVDADRDYVLYWMIANRRTQWNFSLDRAVHWARELKKPLVIFEALRCGYPWASVRLHRFVLDGMAANQQSLANRNVTYYPYVEPRAGDGRGLLEALARRACIVVTDDFPSFFLPRMVTAAASQLTVRCEQIDSNGLLPLRAANREFTTAYAFRRFLQNELSRHLPNAPRRDALARVVLPKAGKLDADILRRWPAAGDDLLAGGSAPLAQLPIDQSVTLAATHGGSQAARNSLDHYLTVALPRYTELRNEPAADATSGLSPYLHFGHISAHEIFHQLAAQEDWSPDALHTRAAGKRSGWWGMSESAEAFLDQLITWRELGYNCCVQREDYDRYESLPDWAHATLAKHAGDPRPYAYSQAEFAAARTHDPLWNAAQRQLVTEGRMHNYLRMLWGKKILEWTATPEEALEVMIELNNKYALDGRNPNSYSGIFWILGRYDRPWGPERPIFGTVRYMSSANTARKLDVRPYLARYGTPPERTLFD